MGDKDMKKPGMSVHSESSFNEASAVQILSAKLEEKKTIKTFFKENDRTPNYDGTFELVGEQGTPKKQFIVQIKKVENLVPKESGKHAGKYIYQLETSFLYYVKEKVTESPAIYFVVDIGTKNIFYLYLSDECLMRLDFEDQFTVQYEFTDQDILKDIDQFYQIMQKISVERNQKFIRKSPEEIAEIQDAVDYMNDLMNHDLKKIKEMMFPNIWRFGVACSNTDQLQPSIKTPEGKTRTTMTSSNTGLFALYPQYKGRLDYGFREYNGMVEQYFSNFDLTGKTSVQQYAKNTLQKIIRHFCNNPSIKLLPSEILIERIYKRSQEVNKLLNGPEPLTVISAYKQCFFLLQYLNRIILGINLDDKEKTLRDRFIKNDSYQKASVPLYNALLWKDLKENMIESFQNQGNNKEGINGDNVFSIIKQSDIEYFLMCGELMERGETQMIPIVDVSIEDVYNQKINLEKMREICKNWFAHLPEIYEKGYKKIFQSEKYKFSCKVQYELYESPRHAPWFNACIYKYIQKEQGKIDIAYCNGLSKEKPVISDVEQQNGLKLISRGDLVMPFIMSGTPLYHGFRCWLYQGICEGLGFECDGLEINHCGRNKLF